MQEIEQRDCPLLGHPPPYSSELENYCEKCYFYQFLTKFLTKFLHKKLVKNWNIFSNISGSKPNFKNPFKCFTWNM